MIKEYALNNNLVLNDYLLIIKPSQDVAEKINELKEYFSIKFECPQALHSKPHITLLRFKQYSINEQKNVQYIKKIIQQNTPFQIKINGFLNFPTHTIYANIETKNEILILVKKLKPIQAFLKIDKDNKPYFITEPYIAIAKKLLPWQYEKAWLEYSNTHFATSFMANEIVLLKKNTIQKQYTTVATFNLISLKKNVVEQVSLF